MSMDISTFDDLLRAARAQPEPQRLLMVFAGAVLPEDSTPEQRAGFAAGEGGALEPLMSVDKDPAELASFAALLAESQRHGQGWAIVLAGCLGGRAGRLPSAEETDRALERMIESVKSGRLGNLISFDRHGQSVVLA